MEQLYDIAVVGGGPGGYSAAIKAAQLGGRVVIFEKENMGGTCLNIGCVPTKCLLEKAALVDKIRKHTEKGIFKDAGLFSWKKIQEQKDQVVGKLTSGVEGILKSYGVEIVKGNAMVKKAGLIEVDGSMVIYSVRNIIIATGSRVFLPKIKGIDGSNVIDSTGALNLKKVPASMVIIGGGVIGLEFASVYSSFGTEVTVVEMLPDIVFNEDRESIKALRSELEKKGIKFVTGAKVEEISDGEDTKLVKYSRDGTAFNREAEFVLAAVGRVSNKEGIDDEKLGLELDIKGNIKVNDRMETNVKGIFAVGDVIGGYQLAHSAYVEAETAAENCMGKNKQVNLNVMPRCIYTLPQFAAVGITEEQAMEKGIPYDKGVYPYAANGKALASDETAGFVKTLSHKETGKLLGVHIVGGYATELLASALTAISLNGQVEDFEKMIFPHPTLSEMVKESVMSSHQIAIHLPKPKK